METRSASRSAAVSEVLDGDNYLVWSVQLRNYLMVHDLWDIVKATNEPPKSENDEAAFKAWSRKNIMALHMIQISCGQRICFVISLITSAKIAWDTLEEICRIPKNVYEASNEESYVAWTNRLKTYFMDHYLWDIVEATTKPPMPEGDEIAFKAWSKKNALALYLIRESCGSNIFPFIGKINEAKKAWDTLAEKFKPVMVNIGLSQYSTFQMDIQEGNWDAANHFLSSLPEAVSAKISHRGSTALHIAIFAGHMNIVEELVTKMSEEDLKIKDKYGYTVLGCCALVGNIKMAKCIIEKCRILLRIENGDIKLIPVVVALSYNSKGIEMARYLYSETHLEDLMPEKSINGATFITRAIYAKAFDMALDLLERVPSLAIALDFTGMSPMEALARLSFAYPSGNQLIFWKQWIYDSIFIPSAHDTNQIPISIQKSNEGSARGFVSNLLKLLEVDEIYELKQLHHQSNKLLLRMCKELPNLSLEQLEKGNVLAAIMTAAKKGTVEFVTAVLTVCPELVWSNEISTERSLYMFAVIYRQSEVFRLVCKSPAKNSIFARADKDSNSILHIAAMFEPSARRNTVPGAAFLMQREIQWYKEVESIVHPSLLETTNKDGKTPRELFTESHKDLVDKGEKWMKETATSCTVVGALIVTIMFAAAITVPGGNDDHSGLPTFLIKKIFMLFIICDALSLLSSSTSVLMFLGILTSRYAEEDFLESLPKKMMIGLSTLIFSIATMMITFCASIFIILPGRLWVLIPVICLAIVPVVLFTRIQCRLLLDMVISTYKSRIFDKKGKAAS